MRELLYMSLWLLLCTSRVVFCEDGPLSVTNTSCTPSPSDGPQPSRVQFKHWFPEFRADIEVILADPNRCAPTLALYYNVSYCDWPAHCHQCRDQIVVDCILSNLDPMTLANTQSAMVLLGVLPAALAAIGPNYIEIGLLYLRRPVLAFLLSAGAPAMSPISTRRLGIEEILRPHRKAGGLPNRRTGPRIASALQYLAALAAVANLAELAWELGVFAICSFSTNVTFMPAIYIFVSVPISIVAALAVRLRIHSMTRGQSPNPEQHGRLYAAAYHEFLPCAAQGKGSAGKTVLEMRKEEEETLLPLTLSWLVLSGTFLQGAFGTMVLASLLFISGRDALVVGARFFGSTLLCNVIVQYEVAGMCSTTEVKTDEKSPEQEA